MSTTTTKPRKPAETNGELPPVKIGSIALHNFMGHQALEVKLDGKSMTAYGSNASGKTSLYLGFLATLGHVTKREVPEPILRGEEQADTEIKLIHAVTKAPTFTLKRRWREGKDPDFSLLHADGSKASAAILSELIDPWTLTPFDWLGGRAQDMVDDVLKICKVPLPIAAVEEITGERQPPKGDESAAAYLSRLSADEIGTYYVRRKIKSGAWDQKRKALDEHRAKLDSLPAPVDGAAASVSELLAERKTLEAQADKRRRLDANVKTLLEDKRAGEDMAARLKADMDGCAKRAADITEQIKRLHEQLQKEVDDGKKAAAELEQCGESLALVAKDITAAEQARDAVPDPTPQIAALDSRIKDHERHASAIAERRAIEKYAVTLHDEEQIAKAEYDRAELILTRIRELRRNLLNGVDLGVDGLEIGDGDLRYLSRKLKKHVTFKQASQAEQIDVAFALAMKRNPNGMFMFLDRAEALDAESDQLLRRRCDENNIQIFEFKVHDDVCDACQGKRPAQASCPECHGSGKKRAELRLDVAA